MRTNQRGSALIISVIVIVVITAIGIGIIRYSAREVAGATAGANEQSLVACAEAARWALQSKFHALGMQPTDISAVNVPLDRSTLTNSRKRAVGGHYDGMTFTNGLIVSIGQVTYLPESAFGPTQAVRDLTNVISTVGMGGRPMKVTVHCQEGGDPADPASGRQLEVEVGIRFGL